MDPGATQGDADDVSRTSTMPPSEDELRQLRACLARPLPAIPSRYFYDDVGSALFERITSLPEYYQTRTELSILERHADAIIESAAPRHIAELGSGAGRKIRALLDAWRRAERNGIGRTCTMLDINALFLSRSIDQLRAAYPELVFRGVVGDFVSDLDRLGAGGERMVVFFAGTFGNLHPDDRRAFLARLARGMAKTDSFLVGVDLVKDPARLEAAYDDAAGVTAAFNRNALRVLNRRFGADFRPERFAHRAFYDRKNAWIEMRLVPLEPMRVRIAALDQTLHLDPRTGIRTELSCKFTRASLARIASEARLLLDAWYPDPDALFALALLRHPRS